MQHRPRQFASDNYAGICPEAWAALAEANGGHAVAYGDDEWTDRACRLIRETLDADCEIFFTFNGTAANSLALAHLCRSYQGVICHESAHIENDECGAPAFFSGGARLIPLPGADGRLDAQSIERAATRRADLHFPQAVAVSITQATELGTVYSPEELKTIGQCARRLGLRVHMDGARLANAVATLNVPPSRLTWEAGVDVLSFGAVKNGSAVGEAVVFFDRQLARQFDYRCKQGGQLCSKMRFLAAPWVGLLSDGAWLRHARHANEMAGILEDSLRQMGLEILFPRQANAVFVRLSEPIIRGMHERGWRFYTFIGRDGCRLMCSWDTTREDINEFVGDIRELLVT